MAKNENQEREYSLLEALDMLFKHRDKKKPLVFLVTFTDDENRTAQFTKIWRREDKTWLYVVKDGPYAPGYMYDEYAAVSAITHIKGMRLTGNRVNYHIRKENSDDGN